MTLAPSETTTAEVVLFAPDNRGCSLARALGGRRVQRGGVRYFMVPAKAEQFHVLHAAGYHAVRRRGEYLFTRDLRPVPLYAALKGARKTK